ncbi:hypothetical protein FVF58_09595 [Paraburkholderia panacisoli]|uniref:Dit-like phage tail protein N-terminal domain-containing protein n=1 Tax=Paraburkholderia panacisoli TaxID=2603818 RepID=A0A5B0HDI0_9BURK|nr:hypothetical protein [Paraburkholderia panacisoli]KAA1013034.1 hypothetical protein FVF58_09595 [Paraburkholderia panacisoli]
MANGIPALLGKVANVTNTVSLVVADAAIILGFFSGPKWGVFNQDGSLALQPDSIVALEFSREWRIPDYPVEQGSFESYNKVVLPSETRIRMTKGGSDADRYHFLGQLSALARSLTLLNISMPEGKMIQSVNINHFNLSRTSTNGVGLVTVDVALKEVRVTATSAFSNTAQPSGSDPTSTGAVQPQAPTSAQSSAASQSQ